MFEEYHSEFTGVQIDQRLKWANHENLLDNPWFTINQRGATTFSGSYGVDMWRAANNTTCTVNADGTISISGNISSNNLYQQIEPKKLLGKTVTMSAIVYDGQIVSVSGVLPESIPSASKMLLQSAVSNDMRVQVYYQIATGLFECGIVNTSTSKTHKAKAAKLELGSVSTLANDIAPDYATELAKCQRYHVKGRLSRVPALIFNSGKELYFSIKLPAPMRVAKPALVALKTYAWIYHQGKGFDANGAQDFTSTTMEITADSDSRLTGEVGVHLTLSNALQNAVNGSTGCIAYLDYEITADL